MLPLVKQGSGRQKVNLMTWQDLTVQQQTQLVLDCDEFEIEAWEIIRGQFEIEGGIVIFACETMH